MSLVGCAMRFVHFVQCLPNGKDLGEWHFDIRTQTERMVGGMVWLSLLLLLSFVVAVFFSFSFSFSFSSLICELRLCVVSDIFLIIIFLALWWRVCSVVCCLQIFMGLILCEMLVNLHNGNGNSALHGKYIYIPFLDDDAVCVCHSWFIVDAAWCVPFKYSATQ